MRKQSILRTPLSYYGGKQKLIKYLVKFTPEHNLYAEPFLGGGAHFFAKAPSEIEVINDTNAELVNFYRVCKNRFHDLQALVRVTLHSRKDHDDAWVIYNKPHLFDEVRRSWAVWVLCTQSFSAMMDGSWGYDKTDNTTTKKISNKRDQFIEDIAFRLQNAQIECADALYIIRSRDSEKSFFYCDPPYYNSDCGHYDGYSEEDFEQLLKCLSKIKGKFLLSSYPSDILKTYSSSYGWHMFSVEQNVSVNSKSGYLKRKVEVLTANFPLK
ncbi:DNA adenine methylase [Danxiaibacter flavus]|uniref:DNA adenine methylase n=1 Tax=Danxiaibacter flavus TaxID=3049108 RepID=A0ABV3ZH60_9BACT|nr:DNA adenine methylase [Chitinophagaceae bacterium DXS]